MAEHVRPGGHGRPRRHAGPGRRAGRLRHAAARPTSCCCRGRSSPSTARCACCAPGCSLMASAMRAARTPPSRRRSSTATQMVRDELMAVLPHLRRLPERVDRILTLTGRGELRVRSVVDEDGRRIVRTLVNRALLGRRSAPRSSPSRPCCSWPPTPDPPWPRAPGCSRSSATAACSPAPCSCCASSPPSPGTGRHEPRPSRASPSDRRRPRAPIAAALRRPPAGRALLPPPRRRRAPRRLGRGDASLLRAVHRGGHRHERRRCATDLGGAATALPRRRPRARCWPSPRSAAVARAGGRRRRVLVVRRRWRRLGTCVAAGRRGRRRVRRCCSTPCSTCPARSPGALDDDAWLVSTRFPSLGLPRRRRRRRRPSASRGCRARWRRAADLGRRRARASTMAVAGTAGVPELLLAVGRRRRSSAPRCWSSFGAPEPPARRPPTVAAGARARPASTSCDLDARAGRRRPGPAVPGRRRPTGPGRSSRSTRSDSRDADLLYRGYRDARAARRRATTGRRRRWRATSSTRRCCCCSPERGGVRLPRRCGPSSPLPDGSMVAGHGRRRRAPARHAGARRRSTPSLLDAVWARSRRCTAPGSPTAPCAPPTSSSTPTAGPVAHRPRRGRGAGGPRAQAIDRAELLASLAALVGAERGGRRRGRRPRRRRPRPRRCPTCSRWRCRRPPAAHGRRSRRCRRCATAIAGDDRARAGAARAARPRAAPHASS